MTQYYTTTDSPFGKLILTSDGEALTGLYTPGGSGYTTAAKGTDDASKFTAVIGQLREYFAGTRDRFDLPLAPMGTAFQQRVWQELCAIPHGETISYGTLAKRLGTPSASRAVGGANGRNPICIIIPCHRVIAADGSIGGYSGGLEVKEWLLNHERQQSEALAA